MAIPSLPSILLRAFHRIPSRVGILMRATGASISRLYRIFLSVSESVRVLSIHKTVQQMPPECLPCARHCSGPWTDHPSSPGTHVQVGASSNEQTNNSGQLKAMSGAWKEKRRVTEIEFGLIEKTPGRRQHLNLDLSGGQGRASQVQAGGNVICTSEGWDEASGTCSVGAKKGVRMTSASRV